MSSRFLNATGAAAIAVMLALSAQTASAQLSFPWERSPQGAPQGQAQSDDADAEMRIQRLEKQLRQLTGQNEELQYRNRQLEERLRQLGAAPQAPGGQPPVAQRQRPRATRFSPIHPAQAIRNRLIRSKATVRKPSPVTASSRRSPRPPRSRRTRQPRKRAVAAAAMRSIPARTPTPPVRRARSAAVRCRSQTKPRSVHRADAVPGNRSISAPPARVIRWRLAATVRRRPAAARSRQRRADHLAALGHVQGRVRSRHRLHAAQGLRVGRRDDEELCAEIPERSPDRGLRNTGSARAISSASNIATPRRPFSA